MDIFVLLVFGGIVLFVYAFVAQNSAQTKKQQEYDEQAKKAQNRKDIRESAYLNAHLEVEKEAFEEEKSKYIAKYEKELDDLKEHLETIKSHLPDLEEDLENCIYFDNKNTVLNADEVSDEKYDKYITDRKYILELKKDIEDIKFDLRELPTNIPLLEAEIKRIKELEFENG